MTTADKAPAGDTACADLRTPDRIEWPTLLMLVATYGLWLLATGVVYAWSGIAGVVLAGVMIAQHSSLQHEALHGHPFRMRWLNAALVSPGLTLTVPFGRFRDTHLAHHHDPILTDPYDDPESNYLDPAVWHGLPCPAQLLLLVNNTLLGRMVVGPLIGMVLWLWSEMVLLRAGDAAVRRDWALHVLWLVPVIGWVWLAAMPWWAYLLAVWIGHGLLKLRTYLEHRAHDLARARTVIVEDRGPFALLFLNNNFHAVHHMHPTVAWYRLPALYAAQRTHYLRRNEGYLFRSYAQVFRAYLLRVKDPVAHPLMPGQAPAAGQSIRRNVGTSPELSKNGTAG
ncbi:MAG: fatty acid desaturase [Rhodobacteraceae bacterium]|nr:fatty acid desaturase [Paracoccaceae bacterium]